MPWVANTNSKAGKFFVIAKGFDDIAQTIMAAVTASNFETNGAGAVIEFVMSDQYILRCDLIELGIGTDCLTTAIHIGAWN
jgi:hypothetical protein